MVRAVHKLFRLGNRVVTGLPPQYLDYLEKAKAPPERVHDDPPETKYLDYNQDHDTGYVYRVPDQPVIVKYPENSKSGLWGGLGAVEGFHKPKRLKPRIIQLWHPDIEKHTFFSDILNVYINVEVTERTLELIDKNKGFDFYILNTRTQDLRSELGRRLQHKMLLALTTDTREYIKEKYKDYIKPREEVEWFGLKEHEAIIKTRLMRIDETIEPPLKKKYAMQLLEQLKQQKQEN